MPALIATATARAHLRVDGAGEDELIELQLAAAERQARHYCRLADDAELPDDDGFRAAVLLILADLYRNREGGGSGSLRVTNASAANLLDVFVDWTPTA